MVHILVEKRGSCQPSAISIQLSAISIQHSAISFHTQQSAIANECLEADG